MLFKNSLLRQSLDILSVDDRRKLIVATGVQAFIGFLDLIGVGLIGLLGALTVSGIQSQSPEDRIRKIVDFLGLSAQSFQVQVALIGLFATVVLVTRTIISVLLTRRILNFLSNRSAAISSSLFSKILHSSYSYIQQKSVQESIYSLTNGVQVITINILGSFATVAADLALLFILGVGLILVDPIVALLTFLIFGLSAFILYSQLQHKAKTIGQMASQLGIEGNEILAESFDTFKDIYLRDQEERVSAKFSKNRYTYAKNLADASFMPYISKYVLESTIVLGCFFVAAAVFILQDAKGAFASLAIFLATGTRLSPAIMRIQQSIISIRGSLGLAYPTLRLIKELESETRETIKVNQSKNEFIPKIEIAKVNFGFDNRNLILKDVNLSIEQGQFVAIVGPSGAGKTTLVNLILGLLRPNDGKVLVSGEQPKIAIQKWPGSIAYVPQEIPIIKGTIKANVLMPFVENDFSDSRIIKALKDSQLYETFSIEGKSLDTLIGSGGIKLSGGQRQRLGIARALLTEPKLIFFDEATSSLDAETEFAVSQGISNLGEKVTTIVIAHRLSTVKSADLVVYLDRGRIEATGSFLEIRKAIPNFDMQAKLMGL